MKFWKKKNCAGIALLAAWLCVAQVRIPANTTTPQQSTATTKPAATPKRKTRTPAHQSTPKASGTASHSATHRSSKRRVSAQAARAAAERRRRAQLRPEPERIQEIQQALAQAGYLSAQPNGRWDDQTREAMRRYQADHGFPETGLPEAKSLMKLGLGPHPLPTDLGSSNGATADATTEGNAPANPEIKQLPSPH